jgi:hypothetical protein
MLNRNTDNYETHVGVLEITMLYMNDLPGCVQNAKLDLFVDDTIIPVVDKDIKVFELKTALVMKHLEAWIFDNEHVLNTARTCAMLFHSSEWKYDDKLNIITTVQF